MNVVLDPGSKSEVEHPRPKLGVAGVTLALSIFLLLFTAPVVALEGDWILSLCFAGSTGLSLWAVRKRYRAASLAGSDAPPTDRRLSQLTITPQDGLAKVGRLGGNGTHLITPLGLAGPYVLVIASNGLGVSKPQPNHDDATAWALQFLRDPRRVDLQWEVLFENISEVRIEGRDVVISAASDYRIIGWFHPNEASHRAQVNRLINTLNFIERGPHIYGPLAESREPADATWTRFVR